MRPAAVSLVENLRDAEYLRLVCDGSLDNLPALFANLVNNPEPDLDEKIEAYRKRALTVFDGGRLPRAGVKLIRSDDFKNKIKRIEAIGS